MGGGASKKKKSPLVNVAPELRYIFEVKIHSASNIPSQDTLSEADPYVKVFMPSGAIMQTETRNNTPSPVWKKKFFCVGPLQDIKCELWDKDIVSKDDFIGDFIIPKASFPFFKKEFIVNLRVPKKKPAAPAPAPAAAGAEAPVAPAPATVIVSAGAVPDYWTLRKRVEKVEGASFVDVSETITIPVPATVSPGVTLEVAYEKHDDGKKVQIRLNETADPNSTPLRTFFDYRPRPAEMKWSMSRLFNEAGAAQSVLKPCLYTKFADLMILGVEEKKGRTGMLTEFIGGPNTVRPYSVIKAGCPIPQLGIIACVDHDPQETEKGTVVFAMPSEEGLLFMKWGEQGAKVDVNGAAFTWVIDSQVASAGDATWVSFQGMKKVEWSFSGVPKVIWGTTTTTSVRVKTDPDASSTTPITFNKVELSKATNTIKFTDLLPLTP